jgi:hypothetical protein
MDATQATELLRTALQAVDHAGTPKELRGEALRGIIPLLAGTDSAAPRPRLPAEEDRGATGGAQAASGSSGSAMLDKVAAGLEIDPRRIHYLFVEEDGVPVLKIKASSLPASKSAAAVDIAHLVMAARQLSGVDDYTEGDVLREAAKRYGRFDSANFGSSMKSLDHLVSTQGKGAATKRKLTIPGIEAAGELAAKYLGDG